MASDLSSEFMELCSWSFLWRKHRDRISDSASPAAPLGDLPENCAALILAHLDPPDICNLSRLNKSFRSASWADFVWESKLPENCEALAARVLGGGDVGDAADCKMRKREIFSKLCRKNTIEGGTMRAWLDKQTGELCLSVSAKGLAITGIDDRRYWNHIPTEESRFGSVAYLNQTWWLEVTGQIDFPFPAGKYAVYFRIQLGRTSKSFGRRVCNTEHVHGWDVKPVRFQLWTSDGQHVSSECFLTESGKWRLYHAGDFVAGAGGKCTSLKVSIMQIDCTHTKGGLCLDSVSVLPCASKNWSNIF